MNSLDYAKKWLQDHHSKIFDVYQDDHDISPEDIILGVFLCKTERQDGI